MKQGEYSQALQDIFVATVLGKNGYYLDIGCADGIEQSNSFILDRDFGWDGLLIDNDQSLIDECKNKRKNKKSFNIDATNSKAMLDVMLNNNCPQIIDYISFDIDDASLNGLIAFPLDKFKFKIMTFEHDIYSNRQECIEKKEESHKILKKYGYECLTENVLAYSSHAPYEDWFYNPEYFNGTIFKKLIGSKNLSGQQVIDLLSI